jgi:4-hydroxy-tetrahydrodipicolinate synthase
MSRLPRPLQGIILPLVTPLLAPEELDVAGLERVTEHVLAGGVSGLFLLGTTGEGPSLSYRLRRDLVTRVCRQVKGRVPVLVGITDAALAEAVAMARHAAEAGADAVVSSAPFYFPPTQPELVAYVRTLSQQVPLPLLLYNMPLMTKVFFTPDTLRQALEIEKIIGLKDSSGDMAFFHTVRQLLSQRSDWTLLIGPEELLAGAVLFGGHGGVSGGANLFPRLFVNLYEAAVRREMAQVTALQQEVLQVTQIYRLRPSSRSFIQGLKSALHAAGLCGETLAEPCEPFSTAEREVIRSIVESKSFWTLPG